MSDSDISPHSLPFTRYAASDAPEHLVEPATRLFHCLVMAKRMLLQDRVREFTAADVIALAGLIALDASR